MSTCITETGLELAQSTDKCGWTNTACKYEKYCIYGKCKDSDPYNKYSPDYTCTPTTDFEKAKKNIIDLTTRSKWNNTRTVLIDTGVGKDPQKLINYCNNLLEYEMPSAEKIVLCHPSMVPKMIYCTENQANNYKNTNWMKKCLEQFTVDDGAMPSDDNIRYKCIKTAQEYYMNINKKEMTDINLNELSFFDKYITNRSDTLSDGYVRSAEVSSSKYSPINFIKFCMGQGHSMRCFNEKGQVKSTLVNGTNTATSECKKISDSLEPRGSQSEYRR